MRRGARWWSVLWDVRCLVTAVFKELITTDRTCLNDSSAQEVRMAFCKTCGQQLAPNVNFCTACGSTVAPFSAQSGPPPIGNQQPIPPQPSVQYVVQAPASRTNWPLIASLVIVGLGIGAALLGAFAGGSSASHVADSSSSGPRSSDSNVSGGVPVDAKIVNVDGSPFTISSCMATLTTTKTPSGNSVPHLDIQVGATNSSQKDLSAIAIAFKNYDSFGESVGDGITSLAGEIFTIKGHMDSGTDGSSEHVFDHVPPNVGKITCTPVQAEFSDDTKWQSSGDSDSSSDSNT
jgi:hypothetical protein